MSSLRRAVGHYSVQNWRNKKHPPQYCDKNKGIPYRNKGGCMELWAVSGKMKGSHVDSKAKHCKQDKWELPCTRAVSFSSASVFISRVLTKPPSRSCHDLSSRPFCGLPSPSLCLKFLYRKIVKIFYKTKVKIMVFILSLRMKECVKLAEVYE